MQVLDFPRRDAAPFPDMTDDEWSAALNVARAMAKSPGASVTALERVADLLARSPNHDDRKLADDVRYGLQAEVGTPLYTQVAIYANNARRREAWAEFAARPHAGTTNLPVLAPVEMPGALSRLVYYIEDRFGAMLIGFGAGLAVGAAVLIQSGV